MALRYKSKNSLLLIEFIIAIGVFALACAICLQLFFKSKQLTQEAKDLDCGSLIVENINEYIQGYQGTLDGLFAHYPSDDQKTIYLSDQLESCSENKAYYTVVIEGQQEGYVRTYHVTVSSMQEVIYQSDIVYRQTY